MLKLLLIVTIVGTVVGVTDIRATEATVNHLTEMSLPEWEGLYGVSQDMPISQYNEMVNQESDEIQSEQLGISVSSSYDPRKKNLVSEIKDQGNTSLCWDYATISTAESCLMKQGYAGNDIDLSELHLAYFSWLESKSSLGFGTFCQIGR